MTFVTALMVTSTYRESAGMMILVGVAVV